MRAALIIPLGLAACMTTGPEPASGPDPFASLPAGVTRDQVYQLRRDPRTGPCYYYRVEGLEVLLSCT